MFIAAAVAETNAQTGELGKILRRMDAYNEKLVTLQAEITVGRQNTQLGDEPELRQGTLIYAKRPGESFIRIDWAKPKEHMAVVDGEYTLFKPAGGKGVAYKGLSREALKNQKSNSALVFLNMTKKKLDSDYVSSYVGEATLSDGTRTIQVKLTPKNKTSHKSADIWIDKDGMLRQASIVEINDDITTMLLTKFTPNPSLKKSDFKIELPQGTKVEKT
jgi:outer membrane lipoprotein-sorting protein